LDSQARSEPTGTTHSRLDAQFETTRGHASEETKRAQHVLGETSRSSETSMESKHAMETLKAKASVAAEIAAEEAKLGTVVSERNTAEKEGEKLLVKAPLPQENGNRGTLNSSAQVHVLQAAMREMQRLRKDMNVLQQYVSSETSESGAVAEQLAQQAGTLLQEHALALKKLEKFDKMREQNRQLYNQIQELRGSIRVFARIRPCKDADVAVLSTEGELGLDQVQVMDKMRQWKSFTFDRVYGPQTTQMDIYQELAPLMRSVLDGYSVCIFAYGQTSSGKTYTMSGPSDRPKSDATKGLQYRVLDDLFDQTAERTASGEMEFTVSVQMLEIYNEQLRDLLVPPASPSKSDFRFIDGVVNTKAIDVSHTDDVVKVMAEGERNRAVGSTALNVQSSRSHSVVTVIVEGRDKRTGAGTRAKLQLVDLAGSERVAISQAEGDRLKEAQYINKSLSALGDVVWALQNKNQHVPYRNSRLTQVLQDSMAGSAKMVMLLHVSPEIVSQMESLSTLNFGVRAAAVERSAPVKTSLATPLNASQMKEVMQDLEVKKSQLEERETELARTKMLAETTSNELKAKTREARSLEGELYGAKQELVSLKRVMERLRARSRSVDRRGGTAGEAEEDEVFDDARSQPSSSRGASPRSGRSALEMLARRSRSSSPAAAVAARHSMGSVSNPRASLQPVREQRSKEATTRRSEPRRASVGGPQSRLSTAAQRVKELAEASSGPRPGAAAGRSQGLSRNRPSSAPPAPSPAVSSLGSAVSRAATAAKPKPSASSSSSTPSAGRAVRGSLGTGSSATARSGASSAGASARPSKFSSRSNSKDTSPRGLQKPAMSTINNRGVPYSAGNNGSSIGKKKAAAPPPEASESMSRLSKPKTTMSAAKDARFTPADGASSPRGSCAASARGKTSTSTRASSDGASASTASAPAHARYMSESLAYSEEAQKRAEEMAQERRKAEEMKERKAKLKKMQREESKIKHITDFDTLLAEAENQLERLAGGQQRAEGETRDDAAFTTVDKIAHKIEKAEADLNENGAMGGKNEKERLAGIVRINRLIGELESDDIASIDMENRLEKSRQIKRCKQIISSLEMAAMTSAWSSPWG